MITLSRRLVRRKCIPDYHSPVYALHRAYALMKPVMNVEETHRLQQKLFPPVSYDIIFLQNMKRSFCIDK